MRLTSNKIASDDMILTKIGRQRYSTLGHRQVLFDGTAMH